MVHHEMPCAATTSSKITNGEANSDLLNASQVSVLTGIPVSTLHEYAMRVEAGLPALGPVHVRLGPRRRRWLHRDVTAWIQERRVVGVLTPPQCTARPVHIAR
jgi:predicted DNA-binding transcriptional regulator AlpA